MEDGRTTREVELGQRAVVLFCVQRGDSRLFRPADDVEPDYGRTLRDVMAVGVEAYAYGAELTNDSVRLDRAIDVETKKGEEGEEKKGRR